MLCPNLRTDFSAACELLLQLFVIVFMESMFLMIPYGFSPIMIS